MATHKTKRAEGKIFDLILPGALSHPLIFPETSILGKFSIACLCWICWAPWNWFFFVVLVSIREVCETTRNSKVSNWKSQENHDANCGRYFPKLLLQSPVPQSVLDPDQPQQELWSLSLLVTLDRLWHLSWPTEYGRVTGYDFWGQVIKMLCNPPCAHAPACCKEAQAPGRGAGEEEQRFESWPRAHPIDSSNLPVMESCPALNLATTVHFACDRGAASTEPFPNYILVNETNN